MALDYYEKRASAIREQWFPEHAPIFETQGNMQVLIWAKPGTGIYKITYIIKANRLMVFGDVGDAIYEWSNLLTWEWLAGLDLAEGVSARMRGAAGALQRNAPVPSHADEDARVPRDPGARRSSPPPRRKNQI